MTSPARVIHTEKPQLKTNTGLEKVHEIEYSNRELGRSETNRVEEGWEGLYFDEQIGDQERLH